MAKHGRTRLSRSTPTSWAGVTTVMLRNIPSRYLQPTLLGEIHAAGFEDVIDYFYLPMDFSKQTNAGYAFLNFTSEQEVQRFRQHFDQKRLASCAAGKLLMVVPASIQGYEANQDHFAHSAVMNHHKPEHGPLFMREDGARRPRAFAYSLDDQSFGEDYLLPAPSATALDQVMQRADAYAWACTSHGFEVGEEAFSALDRLDELQSQGEVDGCSFGFGYSDQWAPTLRESRDLDSRFLGLHVSLDQEPRTPKTWLQEAKGCSETPSTCAGNSPPQTELGPHIDLPWLLPPALLETIDGQ